MTSETTSWDVVIVGGGAAGLSAALILARARRRVLVLDAGEPRNRFAPHMHGVLGHDGVSPLDLVAEGRREVRAADGVIESARVETLARTAGGGFELFTEAGARHLASRVVVATGIRDSLPDVPGLAEHWGRGAVACPYCDGYEARGTRIGVLLGSPAGMHKAQLLRAYSPDVTVFTGLSDGLPADDRTALARRGIRIDDRMIAAVTGDGETLTGVEFGDGQHVALDVLFVDSTMTPLDELLRQLDVERTDTPAGSWPATDAAFHTSVPRLFAIGNVANPAAVVPVAMASGVTAATTINAELVAEDVAAALVDPALVDPATFWEERYRHGRSWSGDVNAALEREAADLAPGTALDLGAGEGGDALWLARRGWSVTAVDISPTALAVGAAAQQPGDDIAWVAADLASWQPPRSYDLVSACFLHSEVALPREDILRRAATAVSPGGWLLIVGHFGSHGHLELHLPSPDEMRASLFGDGSPLEVAEWEVVTSELVERAATLPDGTRGSVVDSVLRLRRA
jgi:thioredoxin reductase/SAM-dependent methyltransferase